MAGTFNRRELPEARPGALPERYEAELRLDNEPAVVRTLLGVGDRGDGLAPEPGDVIPAHGELCDFFG